MTERITQEQFDETFADLRAKPSYLQIAQAEGQQPGPDLCDWYHSSVEHVRNQIYEDFDAPQKQKETVDLHLLWALFSFSSNGAETRMVISGFKPAAFVGIGYRDTPKIHKMFGAIPLGFTSTSAIIEHGLDNPNLGYIPQATPNDPDPSSIFHSGFIYNKAAVQNVAQHNEQYFAAAGYDPAAPGQDIAEAVFDAPDSISQSILLGYSPFTALSFYLKYPNDLSNWGDNTKNSLLERTRRFRRVSRAMLSSKQFSLANSLMKDASLAVDLDMFGPATMNTDYIYKNENNLAAQAALTACGITAYVNDWREKLNSTPSEPSPQTAALL